MTPPAKIFGNSFINCNVGISAPKDADLEISVNSFIGCKKAIEIRDPPALLEALGLSKDLPLPMLREMVSFLSLVPHQTQKEVQLKAEHLGLFKWLAGGADIATLVTGLVQLQQSSIVQTVLAFLQK
ncbi:MAG: hypothetical protein HY081_02925 [Gammaproteobacteria bacterium]|nr:hypothetical protein [Gammaproteobacteria bacterium]